MMPAKNKRSRCPLAAAVLGLLACSSESGQPATEDARAVTAEGGAVDVRRDARAADARADTKSPVTGPRLEVVIRGVGGHVISSPPGIKCTTSCSAHFAQGTTVTLTTQVDPTYWFGGWLGDCAGRGGCTVTMNADRAVSASFFLLNPPWDSSVGAAECQSVWAAKATKLSPCDSTPDDYVVVHKSKRNLALCKSGALVKNYLVGLGFAPVGDKVQQGDGKTPEGVFYVSEKNPTSSYYKALLVSYPDKDDAARGLAAGLITAAQKAAIDKAQDGCSAPPSSGGLGGLIEIHGGETYGDWTAGCVAISDSGMDDLFAVMDVGDTIVILP
jgi:hypothetical protein